MPRPIDQRGFSVGTTERIQRPTNFHANVRKVDVRVPLVQFLQKRGIAGFRLSRLSADTLGNLSETHLALFIAPEIITTYYLIFISPEIQALQSAINPDHSELGGPKFADVTMPIFKAEKTQKRLMALYWDTRAKVNAEWAELDGARPDSEYYHRMATQALAARDELVAGGKLSLPTRREIRNWVKAVVDAKLPELKLIGVNPVATS